MSETYIPFGLKEGKLIHVKDVPSGLACECECPACGDKLVAKKGEERTHHFARYSGSECSAAFETTLHLLAKEKISERQQLYFPGPVLWDKEKQELRKLRGELKDFETVLVEK